MWDTEGNRYLDLLAGFGTLSLGQRPPAVVEAVKAQLDLMPLASRLLFNPAVAEAAAEVASVLPGDLQKMFFCNSGTEAVEGALEIGAAVHRQDADRLDRRTPSMARPWAGCRPRDASPTRSRSARSSRISCTFPSATTRAWKR